MEYVRKKVYQICIKLKIIVTSSLLQDYLSAENVEYVRKKVYWVCIEFKIIVLTASYLSAGNAACLFDVDSPSWKITPKLGYNQEPANIQGNSVDKCLLLIIPFVVVVVDFF